MRDRVAQAAATIVLEPIFEADFLSCSYGFRPKRSATQAMERLRVGFIDGVTHVVEFDIANFFGEIDHDRLFTEVTPPKSGAGPRPKSGPFWRHVSRPHIRRR